MAIKETIKNELNVTNILLSILLLLIAVIFNQNEKKIDILTSKFEKTEARITDLEKEVAVIKATSTFYDNESKKNGVSCNFKQYLCVNSCSEKKRRINAIETA